MFMVAQAWVKPKEYISNCGIFGVRGPSWETFFEEEGLLLCF